MRCERWVLFLVTTFLLGFGLWIWTVGWREISFRTHYLLWQCHIIKIRRLIDVVEPQRSGAINLVSPTQVTFAPATELKWFKFTENTIDLSQLDDVLRVITRQETVVISEKVDLTTGDPALVAIIAAKNISFGDHGEIHHGATPILLIANHFEFPSRGKGRIVAWGDLQARSVAGQPATVGAPAGDVRFVLLGDVTGTARESFLEIDSYGQLGSAGAPGKDGIPRNEDDRPHIRDTAPPLWSFRPYKRAELENAKRSVDQQILKTVNPDQKQRLTDALSSIDECLKVRGGSACLDRFLFEISGSA